MLLITIRSSTCCNWTIVIGTLGGITTIRYYFVKVGRTDFPAFATGSSLGLFHVTLTLLIFERHCFCQKCIITVVETSCCIITRTFSFTGTAVRKVLTPVCISTCFGTFSNTVCLLFGIKSTQWNIAWFANRTSFSYRPWTRFCTFCTTTRTTKNAIDITTSTHTFRIRTTKFAFANLKLAWILPWNTWIRQFPWIQF